MRLRTTTRRTALPRQLPFSRSLVRGLAGKATSTVAELFHSMQYTSAPESAESANAWLDSHQRQFGFFIDNVWVKPEDRASASSTQPSNGALMAQSLQATAEDVDSAVAAAQRAQPPSWRTDPALAGYAWYALLGRIRCPLDSMDGAGIPMASGMHRSQDDAAGSRMHAERFRCALPLCKSIPIFVHNVSVGNQ